MIDHGAANILVFNAGSSSLKWALFDRHREDCLVEDEVEIDESEATSVDHATAARRVLASLDPASIAIVGHRVVHGGTRYSRPVLIDADVREAIAEFAALAPQHNAASSAVIDVSMRALPALPQAAVFDTAFHASLDEEAFLYGLPYEWYRDHGVRRFGFHGISHQYCAERAANMLGRAGNTLKLVICHLGSGCSLAAVSGGRSVATTMGFTPLDGLVMATRPGSVDPGILSWMLQTGRIDLAKLDAALQHGSGLLGLSGISGDMQEIVARKADGDVRANTAFRVFLFRLVEGIAAMTAAIGGIDALVFTAGIGEHSIDVRQASCSRLTWLGLELDASRNLTIEPDGDIAAADSPARILVIKTREALAIARECRRLLPPS